MLGVSCQQPQGAGSSGAGVMERGGVWGEEAGEGEERWEGKEGKDQRKAEHEGEEKQDELGGRETHT